MNFKHRSTRFIIFLLVLLAALLVVRLTLSYFVLRYVNQVLDRNEHYQGHVEEIHLHLWRGSYEIDTMKIWKATGKVPIPLFSSPKIDLSIQWRALFHGSLVGEIDMIHPQIHFVRGPTEKQTQTGTEEDWTKIIKSLFPLKINQLEVQGGEIHYQDPYASPKVDIKIHQIDGKVTNLTNSEKLSKTLAATLDLTGKVEKQADARMHMEIDPYASVPTFFLNAQMEGLELTRINDLFRAYANVDAESGTVSIYTELRSEKKILTGYIKPIIKNWRLLSIERDPPLNLLWEGLVSMVSEIFTNWSKDQIATKVPISGSWEDPDTANWTALVNLIRNAFIKAIRPDTIQEFKE